MILFVSFASDIFFQVRLQNLSSVVQRKDNDITLRDQPGFTELQ